MGWGCGGRPEGPGLTYFVSKLPTPYSPVNSYRGLEVSRSIAGRMPSEDNGGQKVRRKMGETRRSARSGNWKETGNLENWKTGKLEISFGVWPVGANDLTQVVQRGSSASLQPFRRLPLTAITTEQRKTCTQAPRR
jgi:hypothetical protein